MRGHHECTLTTLNIESGQALVDGFGAEVAEVGDGDRSVLERVDGEVQAEVVDG